MQNRILLSLLGILLVSQMVKAEEGDVEVVQPPVQTLPAETSSQDAEAPRSVFLDAELPSESVTPIVDSPRAILNRKIKFESRFEASIDYGWIVDEMFMNSNLARLKLEYHLDELNGIALIMGSRFGGNTTYADQFDTQSTLKFDRVPAPTTSYALGFDQRFYYGKVSIGKEKVLTTVTEANYILGLQKIGSQQMPFASIGLTQRFFVMKFLSLGISYSGLFQQIYDPTSVNIRQNQAVPEESSFKKTIQASQVLGISASFLF